MEQAVQILAADNLDLACTLIERAATDKAVRDTDEQLASAFLARRKHRERLQVEIQSNGMQVNIS